MSIHTELIIEKLGLDPNLQLKKPIRGCLGFTVYDLIEGILSNSSIEELAFKLKYKSSVPIKQAISKILLPHFPQRKNGGYGNGAAKGAAGSWRHELLYAINCKFCPECKTIRPLTEFGANAGKGIHNIRYECAGCHTYNSKLQKLGIIERTPKWADLYNIRKFYNSCPKEHHVDHIIPLRGTLVSGLHVLENLQYLPAEENLKKKNTFNIE